MIRASTWALLLAGAVNLAAPAAEACGCFAPPDPTVPIVQAGERILFSMKDGQVTAHIQIQYAGDAQDFGWLLPLPSVPTLELGADEVFTTLYNTTQPKYRLTRKFEGSCGFGGRGGGVFGQASPTSAGANDGSAADGDKSSPLVIQDSIGPYDYAVLKADSKDAMFGWLTDNHYFIPTGTDETVGNYIRPGAYFLALKLKSGKAAGDLQPVVVRYPSALPMIPIILTSVAAAPNMGVQVWMLGDGRAIPRNFHHAVVNDAVVDWQTGAQNYNDVIIKAANAAPQKHAFVTEYAGASSVMKSQLDAPGRYGDQAELAASADAAAFVEYVIGHGFSLSGQTLSTLQKYIPEPAGLLAKGVNAAGFYGSFRYYTGSWRQQYPADFVGWTVDFQPQTMAATLFTSVVGPLRTASRLFDDSAYLTRLYTTLSPEDMNKDPAFSYNPGLADVPSTHEATLTYHCSGFDTAQGDTSATLSTEQGWVIQYPKGTNRAPSVDLSALPAALRYEVLPEEGAPEVTIDNRGAVESLVGASHCGCGAAPSSLGLVGLALLALRRRTARA